jgi:hypothetical protein
VARTRQALIFPQGFGKGELAGKGSSFMSKTVSKFALAASISLALALALSCSNAQAADNEKRILGTWIEVDDNYEVIWVFNSNGTGNRNDKNFKYGVASDKIAIHRIDTYVGDLSISNDGKTAIIKNKMFYDESDAGYLLRKKN